MFIRKHKFKSSVRQKKQKTKKNTLTNSSQMVPQLCSINEAIHFVSMHVEGYYLDLTVLLN